MTNPPSMELVSSIAFVCFFSALYKLYRRFSRISLVHIPGPEPDSFLLGNYGQFFQSPATKADIKWQTQYGDIVRLTGPLGADYLFVSDPKAMQHILTSGYDFQKPPERREVSRMHSGRGIIWADGEIHRRHRKVINPGFSAPAVKAYTPIFFACASKLAAKWRKDIFATAKRSTICNVSFDISRATLDAIGIAAFDHEFGTMDNVDNALGQAYANLLLNVVGMPTKGEMLAQTLIGYLPQSILEYMTDHTPGPRTAHARKTGVLAIKVAKELVESKSQALLEGKGRNDILSLLIKANASEDPKRRLNEEELLSQMRTIILGGLETTATTLSWILFELARNPSMQKKMRDEIRSMEQTVESRVDREFTPADLDSMEYLNAFVKEVLRFYPSAATLFRQATKDDILPLSKPLVTMSGEALTALPIPKGLRIITSITVYNRNKDIFGEDSHIFDPERWFDSRVKKTSTMGLIGNLMTFSTGVRSCVGWKFALTEIQAFLIELVGSFEFELTPEARGVVSASTSTNIPTMEGQLEKGTQVPLRLWIASRGEAL